MSSRDERQEEARVKWIKSGCKGTVVAATGVGKTRIAINCIKSFINKGHNIRVVVIVPTTTLREQWIKVVDENDLTFNCEVIVVNTAIKNQYLCDLLIIDEEHRMASSTFKEIFHCVKYKYILGLTATFERLDGKHELIAKYCPVIDTITLVEAKLNGWVSDFKEYRVMLSVDDIDIYQEYNKEFIKYFEVFNFEWDTMSKCLGPQGYLYRKELASKLCPNNSKEEWSNKFRQLTIASQACMRAVQKRKAFINNHPKKIEIARKIIEAHPNSKIITFSNNVKMAESIGIGYVYSGKDSKKKGRMTIEEFSRAETGILNTIRKADEGLDCPGLDIAIILGQDSSRTRKIQRVKFFEF